MADRFAMTEGARAVDLATGEAVLLKVESSDGADLVRWTLWCDALGSLRHRSLAVLVDYGLLGPASRFEAWAVGRPWSGPGDVHRHARTCAAAFLAGCGVAADAPVGGVYRSSSGAPVVVPECAVGRADDMRQQQAGDLDGRGIQIVDRAAAAAIVEILDSLDGARPIAIGISGPSGSGRSTLVLAAARAARLRGLVPISARVLVESADVAAGLRGRTLLVLDDGNDLGWRAALEASTWSGRPHVVLMTAAGAVAGVPTVALEPVPAERLAASVRPAPRDPTLRRLVGRAAARADGRPGRFVRTLWRDWADAGPVVRAQHPRAAEQAAPYGVDEEAAVPLVSDFASAGTWAAPGELTAWRRRVDTGVRQLACGRRAPGERTLRQAVAALARRGDRRHAAIGAAALAGSLVRGGRAQAALDVLANLRSPDGDAGEAGLLVETATLAAVAWTDMGRLTEAEAASGSAVDAARAQGDTLRLVDATLALGRCLFWCGRYGDAERALGPLADTPLSPRQSTALDALVARVMVGSDDAGRGVARAVRAVEQAENANDAGLVALARCSAAFAHLAVGDFESVDRDVAVGLRAARAGRDPLRALRLRVLLAERARRAGRSAAAAGLMPRAGRRADAVLPPVVRARCALIRDLGLSLKPPADVVSRHVTATGLAALALFAPAAERSAGDLAPVIRDAIEILGLCQHARDEEAVLAEVCERLRRQLGATGVGFFACEAGRLAAVVARGGRVDPVIAQRAIDAGASIAPHRCENRIEGAVPVRYAGAILGVLAARWTLASEQPAEAPAALGVAATASAPILSALLARRSRPPVDAVHGIAGTSQAVVDLRRAAERAAAAPFPVLIEGESGSGKELVARAVHRLGPRRDRAFCALNCAAIPDDLLEAELFGHARGAFTGAVVERSGVFEEASGGTLFLDEIGELSARGQAKLLRVVQEGEVRRVGENTPRRVDVRITAATNRDLRAEAAGGRFRLDLLYRLDVLHIVVPPLRERREDVAVLAEEVWREATARLGSRATLGAATLAALARYDWPGNVRELQNVLAALAVRTPKRGSVPPSALPVSITGGPHAEGWRLDEARRSFEEQFVRAALARAGGHRGRAAEELGVTRQGLTKLMARLHIDGA